MKNIKLYLLATMIAFVLIAGQPHATVASTNSNTFAEIGTNSFDSSEKEFNVDIASVSVGLDEITRHTHPFDNDATFEVIELVSDVATPSVRINVDVSGYTELANSTGNLNPYAGQLFMIVNGEVLQGTSGSVNSNVNVLLPLDVNTITFFYIGRNADNSYSYDSNTVVIRVSDDAGDFAAAPLEFLKIPVGLDATASNSADAFNASGVLAENLVTGYSLDDSVSPVDSDGVTLTYTNAAGTAQTIDTSTVFNNIFVSEYGRFSVGGTYDSSGFAGQQAKGFNYTTGSYTGDPTHERTGGSVFVAHSYGVTQLQRNSDVTATIASTSFENGSISSPMSVLVVGDLGYWDLEQDAYGSAGADWTGVSSGMYGQTNFVIDEARAVLFAQTATVNVSEQTEDAPGFGILLSMISIGIMAYVAPKLRKD